MRTIVCNFGLGNWAWPECRDSGTIAVMDDVRVHSFFLAGDKEGYIQTAQRLLHRPDEPPVVRGVAARWWGCNVMLLETDGDLWLHKDGDRLFWTMSTSAEPTHRMVDEPRPRFGGMVRSHLYQKPATGWSSTTKTGAPLRWGAIHPKAQDFLVTQGTFAALKPDNALYARALVDGGDLSSWEQRPDWRQALAAARTSRGKVFDARGRTIARIAMTVVATSRQAGPSSRR